MNEPGFLGAGDDARRGCRFAAAIGLQELAAVLGLARRAGGDGDDLVHAVRFGEPAELRQHLQSRVHGLGCERPAVEPAGAQPDHFLLAIDDFERQIGADPHDDHVQRVGADVDGGETHTVLLL